MGVFNQMVAGEAGFGAHFHVESPEALTATPEAKAELSRLLDKHLVLHLRSATPLTPEPLGRIGHYLGSPDTGDFKFVRNVGAKAKPFTRISRVPAYIETLHYDGNSAYSILGSADIPQTAPNLFVDMRQVYKDLPRDLKQIVDTRYALHGPTPPTTAAPLSDAPPFDPATAKRRPLRVARHVNGEPIPWLPKNPMSTIEGLPDAEGRQVLEALWIATNRSEARYTTKMQTGDFLVWEGMSTMHTNPGYPRHVDRTVWFFTVPQKGLGDPDPYVVT